MFDCAEPDLDLFIVTSQTKAWELANSSEGLFVKVVYRVKNGKKKTMWWSGNMITVLLLRMVNWKEHKLGRNVHTAGKNGPNLTFFAHMWVWTTQTSCTTCLNHRTEFKLLCWQTILIGYSPFQQYVGETIDSFSNPSCTESIKHMRTAENLK